MFRVGINIGDILSDGDDIFGDGVNVAARLETLCEPGGVCISRAANEQIGDKLSLAFSDMSERTVKNIARSIGVFSLAARDIALLPEEKPTSEAAATSTAAPQQIRFCHTADGVQLAYACMGHLWSKLALFLPTWRRIWRVRSGVTSGAIWRGTTR